MLQEVRLERRLVMRATRAVFAPFIAIAAAVFLTLAAIQPAEAALLNVPDTVKVSGAKYELVDMEYDDGTEDRYAVYVKPLDKKRKSYTIPHSIVLTFRNGARLTYPVKEIGARAFKGCSKVTSVKCNAAKLRFIGKQAFYKCTKLKTFKSKAPVEQIYAQAFYGCKSLTSFKSKDYTLDWIGTSAFQGCKKLKSVPKLSVCKRFDDETVDEDGFDVSTTYSSLTIGKSAFSGCKSLKSVTIRAASKPAAASSSTIVLKNAFKGCTSLREVRFVGHGKRSTDLTLEKGSLGGCKKLSKLSGFGAFDCAEVSKSALSGTKIAGKYKSFDKNPPDADDEFDDESEDAEWAEEEKALG